MTFAMRLYRQTHPKSRRTQPTAITHSGSNRTVFECICGSQHTTATRHRGRTRHEREWLAEHAACDKRWLRNNPELLAQFSVTPHGLCELAGTCVEYMVDATVTPCQRPRRISESSF